MQVEFVPLVFFFFFLIIGRVIYALHDIYFLLLAHMIQDLTCNFVFDIDVCDTHTSIFIILQYTLKRLGFSLCFCYCVKFYFF